MNFWFIELTNKNYSKNVEKEGSSDFGKMKKINIFWNAIKSKRYSMNVNICTMILVAREPTASKIDFTTLNVVARRFLIARAQMPRKRLPRRKMLQTSTISYCQTLAPIVYASERGFASFRDS